MLAALLGMLLNFEPTKIKFITAYDSRSQLCRLIHQRFDIIGILRDNILQSIHIQGYLEKICRLGIHYQNVSPVLGCDQQVELTL